MNRLSVRLFASYLLVALVGGVSTFLIVRLSASTIFEERLGHMGMGRGQGPALLETFVASVDRAMLLGIAVSLLVAALAAALVSRRVLRSIEHVRSAARRIARGAYGHHVPIPREVELAALAEDINNLGSALEETESRRVRLLGEVAHEMRTPLTVLGGRVEGLVDGVFTATPELLAELQGELARLRRLADDLSALSRVEEGRLDMEHEPVQLSAVVDEAVRRLRPVFERAGVTCETEHRTGPLVVLGDEQRLAQVLANLLGNAVHAMPEGGRVTVTTSRGGRRAVVAVADTGRGLAPADLERVFERFYRVPGPDGRPRRDAGSGIGLTVSRGIVAAHGGTIAASSPGEGQGAVFTVSLPLYEG